MLQFIRVISRRDPRRGRREKRSLGEIAEDHWVGKGRKKTREEEREKLAKKTGKRGRNEIKGGKKTMANGGEEKKRRNNSGKRRRNEREQDMVDNPVKKR